MELCQYLILMYQYIFLRDGKIYFKMSDQNIPFYNLDSSHAFGPEFAIYVQFLSNSAK